MVYADNANVMGENIITIYTDPEDLLEAAKAIGLVRKAVKISTLAAYHQNKS
jgi:hypothetical protein